MLGTTRSWRPRAPRKKLANPDENARPDIAKGLAGPSPASFPTRGSSFFRLAPPAGVDLERLSGDEPQHLPVLCLELLEAD